MALSTEHIQAASTLLAQAASARQAAATWRGQHPAIRMVVVDAMDMRDETPALRLRLGTGAGYSVFLAASNGHCWHVTTQPAEATAFIVTEDQPQG